MRRALTAAVITATALAATTTGATAAAPKPAPAPLEYVALGDSYSAASGVLPLDLTAPLPCLRSSRNFSHVIAAKIGARLTDVSCGAADTDDFFAGQYPGIAPQLDALSSRTRLVTMTIGGNDSSVFFNTIVSCGLAGASTAGRGSPCKDRYGTSFADTVRSTTYPALVRALKAVKVKAPKAKVAIVGYPWITPKTKGCFARVPVAEGDVPYVRSLQTTLNDAVKRAAAATKVTYVDMNKVSEGRDACQPLGTRWIEPVVLGTNPVILHPNAQGEAAMAAQAIKVLGLR